MGSHHHHRRRRSPSPVSSYSSSDADDYVPSQRSHRSKSYKPKPPKTTYLPRGGEADQYYHSDDSVQRGRESQSKRHDKPPAYVTDPEADDYEYEIPRSRIGSVERLPAEGKKHIVDDVLAAFGLIRNKYKDGDKDPNTVYVNADGTRADGSDRRSDRSHSKSHRSRRSSRRDHQSDYYGDDSSESERESKKERRHERNKHLKEAAMAGKMAYKLNKMRKEENEEKEEEKERRGSRHTRHHGDEDYYEGDRNRRRHSHSERSSRRGYDDDSSSRRGHDEDRSSRRGHDDDRSSRSSKSGRSSRSGSKRRGPLDNEHNPDASHALRAAITAAALEAFRSRKTESGMTSNRLMRIAASAIAAGGIDAVMTKHEGTENQDQLNNIIEAVLGGVGSSQFFGHRIRRRHGIGQREVIKTNLMRMSARKALDRGALGSKTKNPKPKKDRTRSSNRLTSAWRAMNDEWGGA